MTYILFFIIIFLVLLLLFTIFYRNRIGKNKGKKLSEVKYFVKKFKLDRNKMDLKKFYNGIALINSLIISFVSIFLMYMDIVWKFNYVLELIVGFILLFLLIYSLYEIYGNILKKKWRDKNGN